MPYKESGMKTLGEKTLKLRDWANVDEIGTRFPPSKYTCPQCGKPALQDDRPPNYSSSRCSGNMDTGAFEANTSGSVKHVCRGCKIAFRVNWWKTNKRSSFDAAEEEEKGHACVNIVPLVECDGELLTPHDVQMEEYKAIHGEYPVLTYH